MDTAAPVPPFAAMVADLSKTTGFSQEDILSRRKSTHELRCALIWAARTAHGYSYPRLGRLMGFSHQPIFKAFRKAEVWREHYAAFRSLTDLLVQKAEARS